MSTNLRNDSTISSNRSQMSLTPTQSLRLWNSSQALDILSLLAVMGLVLLLVTSLGSGHGQFEPLLGAGAIVRAVPVIGKLLNGLVGGGGAAAAVSRQTLTPITGANLGSLIKALGQAAVVGGGITAGSLAFPGGQGLDLGFATIGGSSGAGGGGGATGVGELQPGMRFGETFITRVWTTGMSHNGTPIIHGILANGKRFATNRYGGIKVYRPRKNIVIGADPRLSDARKVARAAAKMDSAATTILKVVGKKSVKR